MLWRLPMKGCASARASGTWSKGRSSSQRKGVDTSEPYNTRYFVHEYMLCAFMFLHCRYFYLAFKQGRGRLRCVHF